MLSTVSSPPQHNTSLKRYAANDEIAKIRKTPKHLNTHRSQLVKHKLEKGAAAAAKPPPPPFRAYVASADFCGCLGV